MKKKKIIVSKCLLGFPCRWHGKAVSKSSFVKKFEKENPNIELIAVCPEELGGLPTPRPPVKRYPRGSGHVVETAPEKENRKYVTGKDVTEFFVAGAEKTLEIAKKEKIKTAILTKWSPSCDKTGITGKLLLKNKIDIINTF